MPVKPQPAIISFVVLSKPITQIFFLHFFFKLTVFNAYWSDGKQYINLSLICGEGMK